MNAPYGAGPSAGRPDADTPPQVVAALSRRDRYLPLWIGAAMVAGLLLGKTFPGLDDALDALKIGQTSLPIALGLLLMMYPVLAKVRYTEIGVITADRRMMASSLVLNWVVGPAVMFALAWLLLPDQPAYRTGVILVGLARCIAMVLIWTDLAGGDREMAAVLVALNAVFQVVAYAALGYFYLQTLPGWLGLETTSLHVSLAGIAGMHGWTIRGREDDGVAVRPGEEDRDSSAWVVVARTPEAMGSLAGNPAWKDLSRLPRKQVWTDDYSDILSLFKWE